MALLRRKPTEDASAPEARSHAWRASVRVALIVAAVVVLLAIAIDLTSAAPAVCSSCHEMEARVEAWELSAHAVVACVKCHQSPTAWYELPQRLTGRVGLLVRDVVAHNSGDYEDPVETRSAEVDPVADEICLQCHDPNRKITSGFRILIDHVEHAKRNGSCISCHVRTAHPIETRSTAMTLMTQCYTCHGTAEQPEASAECGTCHPAGYELLPASHKDATWEKEHPVVVEEDPKQCGMCHEQTFCDDCHGLEMPHPDGWAAGATGHGVIAEDNRAVCARCHIGGPNMCTMCHHTGFDPAQGSWIKQHSLDVDARGTAFCLDCHGPLSCVECHVRRTDPGPQEPSDF